MLTLGNILYRAFALLALFVIAAHAGGGARYTRVKPGQSIQRALDNCRSGHRIVVSPGQYREQLTISKDGVQLIGERGAVLLPPDRPGKRNACTGLAGDGTVAGICITGKNVKLDPYVKEHRKVQSVGSYVKNVVVKGFDVRGFNGLNIAIVGAQDAEVRDNVLSDGSAYGVLTVGSISTLVAKNRVKSSSIMFIAICMDDKSDVVVRDNDISDYGIGLCIQTNGAEVHHNKINNCCYGAFVDPLIDGAKVYDNKIGPPNVACQPMMGLASAGITIAGATNTKVKGNVVKGRKSNQNPEAASAGLLIYDDVLGPANNNRVFDNKFIDNFPDVALNSTGNNEIKRNKCNIPAEICTAQ